MFLSKKIIPDSTSRLSTRTAKKRLFVVLLLFFIFLTLPMTALLQRVYQQFRVEMFYQYRDSSEALRFQINEIMQTMITTEENRPFVDYQFYKISESPLLKQKGIALSPLAQLDRVDAPPGLVGYFQIDPDGSFNTPILPSVETDLLRNTGHAIEQKELSVRLARQQEIESLLLNANFLSTSNKAAQPSEQTQREALGLAPATKGQRALPSAAPMKQPASSPDSGKPALAESTPLKRVKKLSEINVDDSYVQGRGRLERDTSINVNETEKRRQRTKEALADENLADEAKVLQKTRAPRKENILTASKKSSEIFLEQAQNVSQSTEMDAFDDELAAVAAPEISADSAEQPDSAGLERALQRQPRAQAERPAQNATAPTALSEQITSVIGEIDPIQMQKIDSGHYIFYRRVWREGKRYLQGFILSEKTFLNETIKPTFLRGNFDHGLRLVVGFDGAISSDYAYEPVYRRGWSSVSAKDATTVSGAHADKNILVYRDTLTDPLDQLELVVLANAIPFGPGAAVINGLVIMIGLITVLGFVALYRLGVRQIKLAEERLNFVSSVSHELKTPLTSILMYGEMLREGLVADDSKRRSYYDFIYYESERLSRLISNILQLAKLGHDRAALTITQMTPEEAFDLIHSKIDTLLGRNGFSLSKVPLPKAVQTCKILVDPDAFCQIVINLVDNAVKFSANADRKEVVIGFEVSSAKSHEIKFSVRDFGQGVPKSQTRKIFELFYRVGSEMTRTTPGTGIGLALVNALARAMKGRVELINRDPGAEFIVYLPRVASKLPQ